MESTAGIAQHHDGFASLHHISLPCRDVEESKHFIPWYLVGNSSMTFPHSPRNASPTLFSAFSAVRRFDGPTVDTALRTECRRKKLCAGAPLA